MNWPPSRTTPNTSTTAAGCTVCGGRPSSPSDTGRFWCRPHTETCCGTRRGYLDDEIIGLVHGLGGVAAVAASHPHMFGAQLSWSRAFGDVPVYVNALDAEWLPVPDPLIELWNDKSEPLPGLRLIHVGGHMRGSSVALTPDGTLLVGDTISGGLARNWVSFQRNFPKHVPLSAAVVRRIVDRLDQYDYDRLYTLGGDEIDSAAKDVVHRSAETHIRWVSGEFDHLT